MLTGQESMFNLQTFIKQKTANFILLFLYFVSCDNPFQDTKNPISADCIDESKISLIVVCPTDYDPVCGCNLQTYSNACYATQSGVTRWISGECDSAVN